MTMDPSLQGRRTRAEASFDCTKPFGRGGEIPLVRSAAGHPADRPARFGTVAEALAGGPLFYDEIVAALGSDDGREIAAALDAVRREGRLVRDRGGRYALGASRPGVTGIEGALCPNPNEGA
jgi:2,5-furandicarboxylate decarboxylase 1